MLTDITDNGDTGKAYSEHNQTSEIDSFCKDN